MKIALAGILLGMTLSAQAEMWKCIDADGNTRYTNLREDVKVLKGCKPFNMDPPNTIPSPAPRAQQQKPANFPSVDGDTQKQRDAGRRRILEQELAQEQQQLESAKKQLAEQQDIRLGTEKNYARVEERLKPFESRVKLHESNIESLKRELSSVK
jgi:chromosome segregation ATPase